MLADVDPALAVPADRMRPMSQGRWELKAVIDAECQRGLEQLRGLLSHIDPRMTLGQLVERLVREGLDRHDPARPQKADGTGHRHPHFGAEGSCMRTAHVSVVDAPRNIVSRRSSPDLRATQVPPNPLAPDAKRLNAVC